MRYAVGIDVSTTSVKAVLIDETGVIRGVATEAHGLSTPQPLWSEQDPADWWDGVCGTLQTLVSESGVGRESILSVGLTGQMHGLVLLDKEGQVLRPAMLWNDQRTGAECDQIRDRIGRDRLLAMTGNDAVTGLTLPKLLWVAKHEPDVYARVAKVLLPKDYVRYRLTGEYATDKAGAAGTLMVDLSTRDWSSQILDAFSIPRTWLPETFEGPVPTGAVSEEGARATGLAPGTPVVAGAGDQAAQAVGVGAVLPRDVAVTIGTSGVVFCSTDRPRVDPEGRLQAFCHAIPDQWHLMGVMLSAAGSLRWLRDVIASDVEFGALADASADVPPGASGLLFLPYLSGERMPYADPLMRGGFVGLTTRHTRAHLTRAVLEGVCFGLRDGLELLGGLCSSPIEEVRVSGGGAKSPVWRQILADVLGVRVVRVTSEEGAAHGAALLAGVGGGLWNSIEEACRVGVSMDGIVTPIEENVACYDRLYEVYRDAYPSCRALAHRLTEYEQQTIQCREATRA